MAAPSAGASPSNRPRRGDGVVRACVCASHRKAGLRLLDVWCAGQLRGVTLTAVLPLCTASSGMFLPPPSPDLVGMVWWRQKPLSGGASGVGKRASALREQPLHAIPCSTQFWNIPCATLTDCLSFSPPLGTLCPHAQPPWRPGEPRRHLQGSVQHGPLDPPLRPVLCLRRGRSPWHGSRLQLNGARAR